MTGNLLLDLAISLVAVIAVVGISVALGAGRLAPMTEAEARERIGLDEPDFRIDRIELSADRRAAVAVGASGEIAFALRMGDRIATRRVPASAIRAKAEGARVRFRLGDFGAPAVDFRVADAAAAWRLLDELGTSSSKGAANG